MAQFESLSWQEWVALMTGGGVIAGVSATLLSRLLDWLFEFARRPPRLRVTADCQRCFPWPDDTYIFTVRLILTNPRNEGNAVTDVWLKPYGPPIWSILKDIPRYYRVSRAHYDSGTGRLSALKRFIRVMYSFHSPPEIVTCEITESPDSDAIFLPGFPSAVPQMKRGTVYRKGDIVLIPAKDVTHRTLLLKKEILDGDARVRIYAKDQSGKTFKTNMVDLSVEART